jgi:hypothetical protein
LSLALPAVILLLLALPGFVFIYFYRGRLRPVNDAMVSNGTMNLGWFVALGATGIAHAIWVPLGNAYLAATDAHLAVDLNSVAYFLAGEYKEHFAEHAAAFTQHPYGVLGYFASLYMAAGLLGVGLHALIRGCDFDRRFRLFRFNNRWHYLFAGDLTVDAVLVTVTCHHNDHTSLYAGVLDSFEFNGEGQLERLILLQAARAQLAADPAIAPIFTPIAGDKFLIWCRDINTLNVDYLHKVPRKKAPPSSPSVSGAPVHP